MNIYKLYAIQSHSQYAIKFTTSAGGIGEGSVIWTTSEHMLLLKNKLIYASWDACIWY